MCYFFSFRWLKKHTARLVRIMDLLWQFNAVQKVVLEHFHFEDFQMKTIWMSGVGCCDFLWVFIYCLD